LLTHKFTVSIHRLLTTNVFQNLSITIKQHSGVDMFSPYLSTAEKWFIFTSLSTESTVNG